MSRGVLPIATALLGLTTAGAAAADVFESFESGFGRWEADSFIGGEPPPFDYTVEHSGEQSYDGEAAIKFVVDGGNDDGTVWIERTVALPPGTWELGLDFQLHSQGAGRIGAWEVVAFIGTFDPETEEDLPPIGIADTSGWAPYAHEQTIQSDAPVTVWLAVGVNVVFESKRTHFIDAVTITGLPDGGTAVPAASTWATSGLVVVILAAGLVRGRWRGVQPAAR